MGWGRMFFLGDFGQQMDIQDQKQEIEDLRQQVNEGLGTRDSSALNNRIALLEKENGELRLYLAALVRYLSHKGVINQSEFRTLVETIDKEDGTADGSYKGKIMQ